MKQKGMLTEDLSPIILSELVSEIRSLNLPNPTIIPNVGSFFKNPIIKKLSQTKPGGDQGIWSIIQKKVSLSSRC